MTAEGGRKRHRVIGHSKGSGSALVNLRAHWDFWGARLVLSPAALPLRVRRTALPLFIQGEGDI